jgi:serine/threonine protein kinase
MGCILGTNNQKVNPDDNLSPLADQQKGGRRPSTGGVRGQLIKEHSNKDVWDLYEKMKVLGSGMNGQVFEAKKKGYEENVDTYAIKSVEKKRVRPALLEGLRTEIQILKQLDHPRIIKLWETIEDDDFIYMVMEVCTGGELFDRIKKQPNKRYTVLHISFFHSI